MIRLDIHIFFSSLVELSGPARLIGSSGGYPLQNALIALWSAFTLENPKAEAAAFMLPNSWSSAATLLPWQFGFPGCPANGGGPGTRTRRCRRPVLWHRGEENRAGQ